MEANFSLRDNVILFILKRKLIFLGVIGALLLAVPFIFSSRYQLRVLNIALISVLPAIGLTILTGYTAQPSMCQATFFGLGAYIVGVASNMGLNIWIAIILAPFAVALVAFIVGIPALRLHHFYLVLLTVAVAAVGTVMVSRLAITNKTFGLSIKATLNFFGLNLNSNRNFYYFILVIDALFIYFIGRFSSSGYGIILKTVRQAPLAAAMIGVNVVTQRLVGFMISGAIAALGGGLYAAYLRFASPEMMTANESVLMLAAVSIGGMGSIPGSALGAVALKILPELLRGFKNYYYIIYALVMMIFMIYLPRGLAGSVRHWVTIAKQKEYAVVHGSMGGSHEQ